MPFSLARLRAVVFLFPLIVFLVIGGGLAVVGPGLHYDEALFQVGALHLIRSTGPPSFVHPEYGWVRLAGRFWPVMAMPYAGAESDYLLAPVFGVFGCAPLVARLASAAFAAIGLAGMGWLAARAMGAWPAGAALLLLSVHPGLLSNSVFNDSGFSYWLLALGAGAAALRLYLDRPAVWTAALVGLACGFGLWVRLNFLWLLAAAAFGALIGCGRRAFPRGRYLAAALAGGAVGALPLVGWLLVTRFRPTLSFLHASDAGPRSLALLAARLHALGTALLYDGEHRLLMWEGPPLPAWQIVFVAAVTVAGTLAAFVGREADDLRRWHRATSVCLLLQAAIMLGSRLPVREHHFLTLVPLAAVAGVMAVVRLLRRRPRARPAVAAAASLYLGLAISWDAALYGGLARTGGTGMWSDATASASRYLDAHPAPSVVALDWGLGTQVRMATAGRVQPRELFWPSLTAQPWVVWQKEVVPGGLYLTHAPAAMTPMGTAASARFEQALSRSGRSATRLTFRDRQGRPLLELIEIGR